MVGAVSPREEQLSEYKVHDVLRNRRRYHVIEHLESRVGPVTVKELAEVLAERETGESPPPRNIRQSVYSTLHQTHLPKLDDAGIVEYDSDRKTVALRTEARELDTFRETGTPFGPTWAEYYRTLGVSGLLVIVLSELSLPVVSMLDSLLVGSLFLFAFVISIAYQIWSRRWLYLNSLLS